MRGLAMTKALVDDLELHKGDAAGGTVAVFGQRFSRPARLLTRATAAPRVQPPPREVEVEEVEDGLVVRGDVDAAGAGTLRGLVFGATGGGSLPAVIDLTDVSHLGSAGVQVLHELTGTGSGVTLRAPYGSVAQHVLTLARLPFEG